MTTNYHKAQMMDLKTPAKRIWMIERMNVFLPFLLLIAAGILVRVVHVNSPRMYPESRQLRYAVMARGMYYQMNPEAADPFTREQAISLWKTSDIFEMPIFPALMAVTYRVIGSEQLWVSRLYAILFWMIGGLALYDLARRLSSHFGALISLAFYLFVPLGVLTSRWFQSEPLMIMGLILSAYSLYRWKQSWDWKWMWISGIACGTAILFKVMAAFPVVMMAALMILAGRGLRRSITDIKIWIFALVSALIPASYYLFGIADASSGYFQFWLVGLWGLLLEPGTYLGWLSMIDSLYGLPWIVLGLMGIFLFPRKERPPIVGLWIGYVVFGLALPYQIHTHDYYSVILLPILALSLAPVGTLLYNKVLNQSIPWRVGFIGLVLCAITYQAWLARNQVITLPAQDNLAWINMGKELPKDGEIIALTHEYGYMISYYSMRRLALWPYVEDMELSRIRSGTIITDYESFFQERLKGFRYFLVTEFSQLNRQAQLKAYLYDHYPLIREGDGYILFDLGQKKP